jgi:hypothetical protein
VTGSAPRLQRGVGGFEFITQFLQLLFDKFDLAPEFCLIMAKEIENGACVH